MLDCPNCELVEQSCALTGVPNTSQRGRETSKRCLICGQSCLGPVLGADQTWEGSNFVYVWPDFTDQLGGASIGRVCESHTLQEVLDYDKDGRQLYLYVELLPGRR